MDGGVISRLRMRLWMLETNDIVLIWALGVSGDLKEPFVDRIKVYSLVYTGPVI